MRRAFLISLRLHAKWFLQSWGKKGRRLAPLGPRRLVFLFLVYPLHCLLQAMHWTGFLLDEVFFRRYRKTEITAPVFITGIPRAGTTFVHRTLSRDTAQFTTMRTWELLLAPSITGRRVILAMGRLDKAVGKPLGRILNALTRRMAKELDDVHVVDLEAPEEDYLVLLPAGGCFLMALAFPASRSAWQLGLLEQLPEPDREALLDFYHRCLQKHCFLHGKEHRLLSKNAAFGTWIPWIREKMPDARFLVCVRDPLQALSSQLSSIEGGLRFFGTAGNRPFIREAFVETHLAAYTGIEEDLRTGGEGVAVIDQERLAADPGKVLERAARQLGILSDPLRAVLAEQQARHANHSSNHTHAPEDWNLDETAFESCLRDAYAGILKYSIDP